MRRCIICDSTDTYDTLADLGFHSPVTHWHVDKHSGDYICNRCEASVNNTLGYYLDNPVEVDTNNPHEIEFLDQQESLPLEIDDEDEYLEFITNIKESRIREERNEEE